MQAHQNSVTTITQLSETIIFGFDSAWAGKNFGAICAFTFDDHGHAAFIAPELVSFEGSLYYINKHKPQFVRTVVAIDQPTIVPNMTGMRPVERLAGSVISYTGGGVQPANKGRSDMFGPSAPIWQFKRDLAAEDDPEMARDENCGLYLLEVFPALALPGLHAPFSGQGCAPKYNPDRKSKFRASDWDAVVNTVINTANELNLVSCANWCGKALVDRYPRKGDQDMLDSIICALVGCIWLSCHRSRSMLLGDSKSGYMVTPVLSETSSRLSAAGTDKSIPCS